MVKEVALPYQQAMTLLEQNLRWNLGQREITVRNRGGYVGWSNGRGLLHRCGIHIRVFGSPTTYKIVGHECGCYSGTLQTVMNALERLGEIPY